MMLITSRSTPIAPLRFPDKKSERKTLLSDDKIPNFQQLGYNVLWKPRKTKMKLLRNSLNKQPSRSK
jgi:hypothetical protein